jgi:hypothetical protein
MIAAGSNMVTIVSHKTLGFEAERRREVEETALSENIVKRFSFKLY